MNNVNVVIASHSKREAITACLIKYSAVFNVAFEWVLLEDLLNSFEIFDKVSDKETHINWFKSDGRVITNKNYFLINRILHVPDELFDSFLPDDRFYAKREFEAYLGFSLNAFVGVGNKNPNGLCGNFLSLPGQWEKVRGVSCLSVTEYYWGLQLFNPLYDHPALIYSTIYDGFNWKIHPNHSEFSKKESMVFCFLKPKGRPVFIARISNKTLITSRWILTEKQTTRLNAIADLLSSIFDYFIYESLIFVEEDQFTFGSIHPQVVQSQKNPLFESFVVDAIKDRLQHHVK